MKFRWLNEITKAFRLDRELAEVKMSAITFRFVYILRRRKDIIDREFLSIHLANQDSIDRPRKFPIYLITLYPVGVDPSCQKRSARCAHCPTIPSKLDAYQSSYRLIVSVCLLLLLPPLFSSL